MILKLFGGASIETATGPLGGRAAQRHRLALLALLASAPDRTFPRERLLALLWPEADEAKARHLLSDSVYRINAALGAETILVRGDSLRLDTNALDCDVVRFAAAMDAGEWARALELYAGPFLDGFYLSGAAELEQHLERVRDRYARAHAHALECSAGEAEARGAPLEAVPIWRRLAAQDPYNGRVAQRLMLALEAAGERPAALKHAQVYRTLLREEFGTEPDAEITRLERRLREAPLNTAGAGAPPPTPRAPPVEAGSAPRSPTLAAATADAPHADHLQDAAHAGARPISPRRRPLSPRAVVAVVGIAAVLGGGAMLRARLAGPASDPATIAVLPFSDLSPGGDHEYFSDGMADELINALAGVEGVRVAGRTSSFAFKGRPAGVPEIGAALGVDHLLEGSVRTSGDRMRVTVELVSVADGHTLWGGAFERPMTDVFAVQDEIARAIVRALEVRLVDRVEGRLVRAPTDDLEAYNLYLRGRYYWHRRTRESLLRSAGLFERAIDRAPEYAHPYAGLADALAVLAFYDYLPPRDAYPRAKAAATRAVELDPTLAEPHASLGYVALYYDRDAEQSERHFRRSLGLDPGYSVAHQWYANLLVALGRFDEAEREMSYARETNPLSLIATGALGWVYLFAGRYEDAIEQCDRALEMDPWWDLGHLWRGLAEERAGRRSAAIASLRSAVELSDSSGIAVASLALAYAAAGDTARADSLVARLTADRARYVPAYEIARVNVALGRDAAALAWLERAHAQGSHSLVFLEVDPHLAPLRDHPEFLRLVQKIGFRAGDHLLNR